MKKFSAIIVVCLALFVSVFFASCGSKYKDLNMYFVLNESKEIQLIMDDEYWASGEFNEEDKEDYGVKTIKVNLDGIKKKNIGDVDVKVIPSDLAVVRENEVIGNSLYFNVYASRPGTGEIQVTHLSSGKSISVTLDVDKKAISATANGKGIVVNIPEPNADSANYSIYKIDPSSVLNYLPFDATDDVSWQISGSDLRGVEVGNFDKDKEGVLPKYANGILINDQIKVSSEASEGLIYITPTLVANGYRDIELSDIKIPVSIFKVVQESSLRLLSDNAIVTTTQEETINIGGTDKTCKNVSETIYLFTNSLKYCTTNLHLYTREKTNVLTSEKYINFYNYEITKSSNQLEVKVNTKDGCIDLTGIDFNENLQWFEINFTPNNCVGDINAFTVRREVVLTEIADRISMKMDGHDVSTNVSVDGNGTVQIELLDHYVKNEGLGQRFNFNVYRTSTHSSLKKLRVKLSEDFYKESTKNQYYLEFKKGKNEDLQFVKGEDGFYYSELFEVSDSLYVKYTYNQNVVTEAQELYFEVFNCYTGEPFGAEALNNTEKRLTINIERGRGIASMELVGAYIEGKTTGANVEHDYGFTNDNSMFLLNDAVATKSLLNEISNNSYIVLSDQMVYGVQIKNVRGTTVITDTEVINIDFEYKVYKDGKEVNLFDLLVFNSNDNFGIYREDKIFNLVSISDYQESNTLILVKKPGVTTIPNGDYILEISEPEGGCEETFTYKVVSNVSVNDADVTPFNTKDISSYDKIYLANDYRKYLFNDLFNENNEFVEGISEEQKNVILNYLNNTYIVPTKQDIDTTVRLGSYNGLDFVFNESLIPYVKDIQITTTPVSLVYDTTDPEPKFVEENIDLLDVKYVSNDRETLVGDFKFDIKLQTGEYGTIYNGEKHFIKVTYQLFSEKYDKGLNKFYEQSKDKEPVEISFYFFIYLDLNKTAIEDENKNDSSIVNTYFYDDLGYYLHEEGVGTTTIKLSLPNQYEKNQSVFDYINYSWEVTDSYIDHDINYDNHSLTFRIMNPNLGDSGYYDRIIKVNITQFGVRRTLACTIHVHKVTLTNNLVVRNSLKYLDSGDGNTSYYIYLKKGDLLKDEESYTFDVEQIGNPTFNGVKYVVCDLAGNIAKDYKIDANGVLVYTGDRNNVKVKDLKVLIFAKDWVTRKLDSEINTFNFDDLSEYTCDTKSTKYSLRVQQIDLKLRDGSKSSPYLIASAEDFSEIEIEPNAHYEIVNDINLSNRKVYVEKFSGSLTSYKDYKILTSKPSDWSDNYSNYYTYSDEYGYKNVSSKQEFVYRKFYKLNQTVYTVYNIFFTDDYLNMFGEVSNTNDNTEISNISFRIDFNNANSNVGYIGLIAKNYGDLKNVKVEYLGNLTINSSSSIYVGMLVAQNFGNIVYDNANTVYSTGTINITENTTDYVNIGGLVGENQGSIVGVLEDSNNTVEYAIFYENQGSLFDGNITVSTSTSNTKLNLGGVVGHNIVEYDGEEVIKGKIQQVYSSGKLQGYNNVGGLIGNNESKNRPNFTVTYNNASIIDCLSTAHVKGNNYVGGVIGKDTKGTYYHVYYEVYENAITENDYAVYGYNNVGGLIGYGSFTQLNYCYFHSYRWSYEYSVTSFDDSEFKDQLPEILGNNYVGGLFGYADSGNNSNHNADYFDAVCILNSVVDAYALSNNTSSSFVGGMIGYAYGYAISKNTYVQGAFIGQTTYNDMIVRVSNEPVSNDSKDNYYSLVFGNYYNNADSKYKTTLMINNEIYKAPDNTISNLYDKISNTEKFKLDERAGAEPKDLINYGRYYIEIKDQFNNAKPLITQAPTEIVLDEALIVKPNRTTNKFNTNADIGTTVDGYKDKILIYYYNLLDNNQENFFNDSVSVNIISIDDIIKKSNILVYPLGTGARLKVTSLPADNKVLTISPNGTIKLIGEGVCTLRFASLINPSVYDEITVIIRSMPKEYNIYKNSAMNEDLNNSSISIVAKESKFVYENYIGKTIVNGTEYLYTTTNNVAVFANVYKNNASTLDFVQDENILINGIMYDSTVIENSVSLKGKEPVIISVLKYSEEDYIISMASYVMFNVEGTDYYVLVQEKQFTLITKRGVTAINTNITDAVMSVADKLNVDLSITTDTSINTINIAIDVRDEKGNIKQVYDNEGLEIDSDSIFTYNHEHATQFNVGVDGYEFVLKLNQNIRIEEDLFVTVTFSSGNEKCEMYLTLIPQKITSIVSNAYKQEEGTWKSSSVIRPGEPAMFVIDVAPDTAYFKYLEITDTFANEKILFIQWSDFDAAKSGLESNGQALQEVDTPSSDGYGIKLVKTTEKSFYVYALLDVYAINNNTHTIMVTAYSSSGYILGVSYVNLEVMLYPTVILSYYNENDQLEITADSRQSDEPQTDLAVGVQAKIGVTTYNTDGSLEWTINVPENNSLAADLSMQLSENGYWYLTYNKTLSIEALNALTNNLVGKTITITAKVKQVIKGFEEEKDTTLIFKCRLFTLNGISAQTARQTSGNRIGGIVNEETYLEFYFNNTQNKNISYYHNGEYFNKNYYVDFNKDDEKDAINKILKEINNFTSSDNVILKFVHSQTGKVINLSAELKGEYVREEDKFYTVDRVSDSYVFKIKDVELFKITKINKELTKLIVYTNAMNSYNLQIDVKYHYNHEGKVVLGEDVTTSEYNVVTNSYGLNFVTNSAPNKYYPIKNSEEFMNMVAGEYYILERDIDLTDYKMLDIELGGFDGNGHKITIKNYDYDSLSNVANGTIGYLGLFKQIYKSEIVENLTVVYTYSSNHYNLSNHYASDNTDYTEFHFGGIAAINAGIITNCKVEGSVVLQASKISPANFYLGGMVDKNLSTGFITNSTCTLELDAGGTIGGIANSSEGKIVSTNFLGVVKAYTSKSTSLSNEIIAACLVVTNSGEISMCYVGYDSSLNDHKVRSGLINSGGSLGGFVYINSGKIYDCYLKDITFSSRGYMGGFVYSSTGTVERCYIDSITSLQGDRYIDIFAYDKENGTFKDCFFIITEYISSSINGVKCIVQSDINVESKYNNFAFNTEGYNVWQMTSNGPILPNAGALLKSKVITRSIENGVEKIDYSIAGTKEIPYIIYDLQSFDHWFKNSEEGTIFGYFRFVADIDFTLYKDVLVTSNKVFSGTIEGNNMILSNFSLFTSKDEQINSIGLFKEIRHTTTTNYVSNLILKCISVRASSANNVGVLAGIIDGGNVYSIQIDNPDLVILGKNAVGGLAGTIKGSFAIENITTNVSVNASYRQTVLSKINIYNGRYNTGSDKNNINEVSYAGGIAGIVEGYDYRINPQNILNNYYSVKNSLVTGNVILIGETVGGAFGFVNERARISNVVFEVGDSAYLKGLYYSGGLVGENRGIIDGAKVIASPNALPDVENITLYDAELNGNLANCVGGITAVNYGGLIYNCVNEVNVINMNVLATVGGIAGRNVNGTINHCQNNAALYGFFMGNMVGADYGYQTIANMGNSSGSITSGTILVISRQESYSNIQFAGTKIKDGIVITLENIDKWYAIQKEYKEISSFYKYTKTSEETEVDLYYFKILGAVVGITDKVIKYELPEDEGDLILTVDSKSHITIIGVKATEFVATTELKERILMSEIQEYYYIIPVSNEKSYNFYNLTQNGYKDEYVRVVKTK